MRGEAEDTKLCRAIGCRRRIADTRIFCSTHFNLLPPKNKQPVEDNREPTGTDVTAARRVSAGAAAAVAVIAKIEGKAATHKQAVNRNITLQTGGGSHNTGGTSGGGNFGLAEFDSTVKFQEF